MPEGVEKNIDQQQMADLIAFLREMHQPVDTPSDPLHTRDFGTLPGLIEPKEN